ncbi:hypothetical protein, partial [uncultured Sphingomonas sp.]|uniref:hypothetical protein n=1 Tax=uncultured Sphingomonas sp. TaxID=158754 RepID=UPI0025F12299
VEILGAGRGEEPRTFEQRDHRRRRRTAQTNLPTRLGRRYPQGTPSPGEPEDGLLDRRAVNIA